MIGRLCAVRHFSVSAVQRSNFTPKYNSGLHRRLRALSNEEPDIIEKADVDEETVEALEQDFMEAAELHDEVVSNIEGISKIHEYKIIERKYFRPPKEPNMLTWSEKEQIRFLHQNDPEKWTPESLAESFPATPTIIKKLLRAKWKPRNVEKLKEHDTRASDNWKAFHRGKLTVHDPHLKTHLEKFTDRKYGVKIISDEEAKKVTEVILPRPKRTEFLSLITSFRSKNEVEQVEVKTKLIEENNQNVEEMRSTNPLSILERSKANYTLEQFQTRLGEEAEKLSETPEEIKAIIGGNKKHNPPIQSYVAPSERYVTDAVVRSDRKNTRLYLVDPDKLPNKIRIPKEVWKAGQVYRVSDSFYNDEGLFLYRVPGLKTN